MNKRNEISYDSYELRVEWIYLPIIVTLIELATLEPSLNNVLTERLNAIKSGVMDINGADLLTNLGVVIAVLWGICVTVQYYQDRIFSSYWHIDKLWHANYKSVFNPRFVLTILIVLFSSILLYVPRMYVLLGVATYAIYFLTYKSRHNFVPYISLSDRILFWGVEYFGFVLETYILLKSALVFLCVFSSTSLPVTVVSSFTLGMAMICFSINSHVLVKNVVFSTIFSSVLENARITVISFKNEDYAILTPNRYATIDVTIAVRVQFLEGKDCMDIAVIDRNHSIVLEKAYSEEYETHYVGRVLVADFIPSTLKEVTADMSKLYDPSAVMVLKYLFELNACDDSKELEKIENVVHVGRKGKRR